MSGQESTYLSELNKAMLMVAKNPKALFIGQAVAYPGQAAFKTFDGIPMEQRIEMPVAEDFQMGFCTGLALQGYLPVSFYPRWDFLLLALNQLVNHLDKLPHMGWRPKVIIRTAVGRRKPLDPGPQHSQDYTKPLRMMLYSIPVVKASKSEDIIPAYKGALENEGPTVIVEDMEAY